MKTAGIGFYRQRRGFHPDAEGQHLRGRVSVTPGPCPRQRKHRWLGVIDTGDTSTIDWPSVTRVTGSLGRSRSVLRLEAVARAKQEHPCEHCLLHAMAALPFAVRVIESTLMSSC